MFNDSLFGRVYSIYGKVYKSFFWWESKVFWQSIGKKFFGWVFLLSKLTTLMKTTMLNTLWFSFFQVKSNHCYCVRSERDESKSYHQITSPRIPVFY